MDAHESQEASDEQIFPILPEEEDEEIHFSEVIETSDMDPFQKDSARPDSKLQPWDPTEHENRRFCCGWCLTILDCEDPRPSPQHRLFTRCTCCGQLYHLSCSKTKLTGCVSCHECDEFENVTLPSPPELKPKKRVPIPHGSGPLNSLRDNPVGISKSQVVLNSNALHSVEVRNNSFGRVKLKNQESPFWMVMEWDAESAHGNPTRVENNAVQLEPGDTLSLWIRGHLARPLKETLFLKVTETQGIQVESRQSRLLIHFIWAFVALFLVTHVVLLWNMRWEIPSIMAAGMSLGMVFGLILTFSPGLLRSSMPWIYEICDPSADWLTRMGKRVIFFAGLMLFWVMILFLTAALMVLMEKRMGILSFWDHSIPGLIKFSISLIWPILVLGITVVPWLNQLGIDLQLQLRKRFFSLSETSTKLATHSKSESTVSTDSNDHSSTDSTSTSSDPA